MRWLLALAAAAQADRDRALLARPRWVAYASDALKLGGCTSCVARCLEHCREDEHKDMAACAAECAPR